MKEKLTSTMIKKLDRKLGQCVNNKDHLYTYDHTTNMGGSLCILSNI